MANSPFFKDNIRELLNNMTPGAARAALGDIIVELQAKAGQIPAQAVAVSDIADPGTATAPDVAAKVNELLGALRTAGVIASS